MITEREKALWDLLDDIDTAFDAFRPHMEQFEHFVQSKVDERNKWLTSGGYELSEPKGAENLKIDIADFCAWLNEAKAILNLYADYPLSMVMSATLRDKARNFLNRMNPG